MCKGGSQGGLAYPPKQGNKKHVAGTMALAVALGQWVRVVGRVACPFIGIYPLGMHLSHAAHCPPSPPSCPLP